MLSQKENRYLDVKESNITRTLESQGEDEINIRNHAVKLILESMENRKGEVTTMDDLICLPLALWILKSVDENILTARVLNHARDLVNDYISKIITYEYVPDYSKRYGVEMDYDAEYQCLVIPVSEFVTYTSRLSGADYRLVYQNIHSGKVFADQDTAAKVVREAFVRKAFEAYNLINKGDTTRVLLPFKANVEMVKDKLEKSGITKDIDLGEVDAKIFPPCIKEFISQMQDGVNLPHMARFTLVSFLHKIGMKNEGIMGLFRTAPDFKESLTKYQVDHVTGEISSTEYSPPKCSVLQSNHLCYKGEDTLCAKEWLNHPLKYYTIKKKPMKPLKGGFARKKSKTD